MLESLRNKIRTIDAQIAELVAQRLELAVQVGQQKEQLGLAIRDFSVEKAVLSRARDRAEQLGIDSAILEEIALLLIKSAVDVQEKIRTKVPIVGDLNCTIIGGGGKMGGWFERFVISLGYNTQVVEQDDTLDERVTNADLIILAVPLGRMRPVLKQILALQPQGIVLEIASLKSHLVDVVNDGIAGGLQIACIHPMFGPDKDLLVGQNVIICRAGCQAAEQMAISLFSDTAANLAELPLDEHDRYMTWVLNLPHLISLAMGETLRGSGLPFERLTELGGTTFSEQMRVTEEVMSENPELYYNIQHINRHRTELYAALCNSVENIGRLSDTTDATGFIDLMQSWNKYTEITDDHS